MLIAIGLVVAPALRKREALVVWNASPSLPIGLYVVQRRPPDLGKVALVRLPTAIAKLASRRGYLPRSTPLLKTVAAAEGDRVCRIGTYILVRRRIVARALFNDWMARRLPAWQGCRTLGAGELFLLTAHPVGFDSRYFGPIDSGQVIGTATPVWIAR